MGGFTAGSFSAAGEASLATILDHTSNDNLGFCSECADNHGLVEISNIRTNGDKTGSFTFCAPMVTDGEACNGKRRSMMDEDTAVTIGPENSVATCAGEDTIGW